MKKTANRFKRGTRTGFTTGACAAAAAAAATKALVTKKIPTKIKTLLANGDTVFFSVADCQLENKKALAVVIKDAGDDPDCTNGAHLTAVVEKIPNKAQAVDLHGGSGVGRVTRLGVGLEVGSAAINPIPRSNIIENVRIFGGDLLANHGLSVTISVPGGEKMATKTLNPRLGIVDGISILGTGGIVYPYSTSAYKACVQQSVGAASAIGADTLIFTTGRRTERFAMKQRADLPEHSFIQMGDFFAAAMAAAKENKIPTVIVAAMAGKLAKIGQGMDNTHAHKNSLDMSRVAAIASRAGGSSEICSQIAETVTVRHATELLNQPELVQKFYQLLTEDVAESMAKRLSADSAIEVMAFDFSGTLLAHWKQLKNG
ncbi:MAG: cobalt-precorrin-5B (C(1))-methyltransferase [Magnetococcales bacterium]|nr:cobalt-precorrin-5B (C(1))-methyltransferase [Magnetococcales bacterium]